MQNDEIISDLKEVIWCGDPDPSVFHRWSQGFEFKEDEPTALIQRNGGPCAVLVPVQGCLLKNLLFNTTPTVRQQSNEVVSSHQSTQQQQQQPLTWRDMNLESVQDLLIETLADILEMISKESGASNDVCYILSCSTGGEETTTTTTQHSSSIQSCRTTTTSMDVDRVVGKEVGGDFSPYTDGHCEDAVPDPLSNCSSDSNNTIPPITTTTATQQQATDIDDDDTDLSVPSAPITTTDTSTTTDTAATNKHSSQGGEEEEELDRNPGNSPITTCSEINSDNISEIELFHNNLYIHRCESREILVATVKQNLTQLTSSYGVLLFLYSAILTKGIELLKQETADPHEPLIDRVHGHGGQCLINLFITGRAVTYVFDNDREIGGMKLFGIDKQPCVGFLAFLEHLRYCAVGAYLKNPNYPLWVLASETHLTLFFTLELNLVAPETEECRAQRVFSQYDTEDCGFISSHCLQDVMASLGLVSDIEYVDIMKTKLDPDVLGIILLNNFLDEFYPDQRTKRTKQTHSFNVYHYNGLVKSNNTVVYKEGKACIEDFPNPSIVIDDSQISTCLQTKWRGIEIVWQDTVVPSLN